MKPTRKDIDRYIDLSFDISDKIYEATKGMETLEISTKLGVPCEDVLNMLSGTYNFTIYQIAMIETKLNIKLI